MIEGINFFVLGIEEKMITQKSPDTAYSSEKTPRTLKTPNTAKSLGRKKSLGASSIGRGANEYLSEFKGSQITIIHLLYAYHI